MQYKSLRTILNLFTSIILLAHTFVPHHHAEEHLNLPLHHHEHTGSLGDLFTDHCHSGNSFISFQRQEIKHSLQVQDIIQPDVKEYSAIYAKVYKPCRYTYNSEYKYISPHLLSLDFRGPPTQTI